MLVSGPVALGSARSCMIVKIGDMTNYVVGNSTGLYITPSFKFKPVPLVVRFSVMEAKSNLLVLSF